jgi:aminoglycoside phosphotransferase (APT) family kinase protein
VVSDPSAWQVVARRLEEELGEPVRAAGRLARARRSRETWAASTETLGELVVKVRHGDRADEKTQWCAANLPRLAARGYPVPTIVWHGLLEDEWHAVVQRRLPGHPLASLNAPMLDAMLSLVDLQADADADISPDERDFAGYIANVLFDDWDHVWGDAARASTAADELCGRIRGWLQPVWGLQLPPTDYTNNDLNLSNVLSDGKQITGVVDWDEFGLGSRAIDLTALAFDCERLGDHAAADRLFARAVSIVGSDGLRCIVSYRAIAQLAALAREHRADAITTAVATSSGILDKLDS